VRAVVGLPQPDVRDARGVELGVEEAGADAGGLGLDRRQDLVVKASARSWGLMASHSGVVLTSMNAVTRASVVSADLVSADTVSADIRMPPRRA
jgi:hypothetical protein